jgi:small-conductance mechanosensitive channel
LPRKTLLALALLSVLLFPLTAEQPPPLTANDVVLYLTRAVAWYRRLIEIDKDSAVAESILERGNAQDAAERTLEASFAFARAEAAVLSSSRSEGGAGSSQSLEQSLNKASTRVSGLEARLESLNARIAHSGGRGRNSLEDERTAITADLALAKQIEAALRSMTSFSAPKSGGRRDEIAALQAANPLNDTPPGKDKGRAGYSAAGATAFQPQSSGIIALASRAFDLEGALRQIDQVRGDTDGLLQNVNDLRTPMRTSVRAIVAESDRISANEDAGVQASQWITTAKQIGDLGTRFKQLSAVLIPLGETALSLESAHAALDEWRNALDGELKSALRQLAVRLGVLLAGVLLVLLASAIWERAILRYVTEPRRRRQLLLVKRVVVGICLVLVLALGFVSSLASLATLLGLITAGLALALQNVILSAVAYFFLVGRHGVRVGDRVTVQGVTGQVTEVGLIRLFLMELVGTGTDMHPTGRLAVFANSVIFQPAALMKQAPGMDYAWHSVTATVEDPADYQQTRERLTKAVKAVYEDYRQVIDRQHKVFELSTDMQTAAPAPVSRAQFSESGLDVIIRYPVSLADQPSHVDEQIVDRLIKEADQEPKLKFTAAGSPKIAQVA